MSHKHCALPLSGLITRPGRANLRGGKRAHDGSDVGVEVGRVATTAAGLVDGDDEDGGVLLAGELGTFTDLTRKLHSHGVYGAIEDRSREHEQSI